MQTSGPYVNTARGERGGGNESGGRAAPPAAPSFPAKCSRRTDSHACPWREGPARRARPPPAHTHTLSGRRGALWPRACQENKARAARWNEETAALAAKGRTGKPRPRPPALRAGQPAALPSAPGSARPRPTGGRGPFLGRLEEGGEQRRGRLCTGRCWRPPPGARARTRRRACPEGRSGGLPAARPRATATAPGLRSSGGRIHQAESGEARPGLRPRNASHPKAPSADNVIGGPGCAEPSPPPPPLPFKWVRLELQPRSSGLDGPADKSQSGRGEPLISLSSRSQRLPRCSPAQAPPQHTHTHTHTGHSHHITTHANGTAVMKPTRITSAQVNRYRNEKPPPVDWAIYLSLLETRVAYRVLGVICCCLRSPPPLLVERSQKKKKKKNHVPLSESSF